jgi:hypothetical protein
VVFLRLVSSIGLRESRRSPAIPRAHLERTARLAAAVASACRLRQDRLGACSHHGKWAVRCNPDRDAESEKLRLSNYHRHEALTESLCS